MQRSRPSISRALAVTLALGLNLAPGASGPARAQGPPTSAEEAPQTKPMLTPRGGTLAKTARHQFEVFFYKTGVPISPHDAAEKPVAVSSLTGTATFALPGVPTPFVYPLRVAAAGHPQAPGSLDLALDLSKVPESGTKAT